MPDEPFLQTGRGGGELRPVWRIHQEFAGCAALIDLHALSVRLYQALGTNLSQAFQDGTHHNSYGSYELAKCVAAGMAAAKLDLGLLLVEDVKAFDLAHPDPVEKFNVPPSPMRSTRQPDGN